MKARHLLLTFLTGIFALSLVPATMAQTGETVIFKGTVIDFRGEPLKDVLVTDTHSRKKTTTDANGYYELELAVRDHHLRFSHVGYKTENRQIEGAVLRVYKKKEFELLVVMVPATYEIPEALVMPREAVERYAPDNVSILDFAFSGDSDELLVLMKEGKRVKIRHLNNDLSVVRESEVSPAAKGIIRDCLGNFHLDLGKEVAQITEVNGRIAMADEVKKNTFDSFFGHCVASNDEFVVFREYRRHNSELTYFTIHRETKEKSELMTITDRVRAKAIENAIQEWEGYFRVLRRYDALSPFNQPEIFWFFDKLEEGDHEGAWAVMTFIRWSYGLQIQRRWPSFWQRPAVRNAIMFGIDPIFLSQMTRTAIYNPLFSTEDGFVVFDHVNHTAVELGIAGNRISGVPIVHQELPGWKRPIIKDEVTGVFYARASHLGFPLLVEIDMETGGTGARYMMTSGHVPDEMMIRDGKAYFTAVDHRSPYRKLFVWNFRELSADLTLLD